VAELYNHDYERAILGAAIFDPEQMDSLERLGVEEGDFYHPFHQKLYRTMRRLYEESTIEEGLIREAMGSQFDEVVMLEVLAATPVTHIEIYAQKIREYAKLREAKQMAYSLLKDLESDADFDEILKSIHQGVEHLDQESRALFDIVPLAKVVPEEAKFVCKTWLPFPMHTVSMVTAGGGVGKSFLLLQSAMRMIRDEGLRIFMWLSEDPLSLSKYRAEMIASEILETDIDPISEKLHLAGAEAETIHFLEESRGGVEVSSKFYRFKRMLQEYDVIILDPLIAMFGADENNNAHARLFVNLFTRWATKEKKTIIFIHHSTKNTSQSRGASAFVDAVRLVYRIEPIKNEKGEIVEDSFRNVILDKDNNGAKKYLGGHKVKREVFPQPRKAVTIEYV